MEIWKDIPDYEGRYQASSYGRIKSLSYTRKHWQNGSNVVYKEKVKNLKKPSKNTMYLMTGLHKDNTVVRRAVHQWVAITFLGLKPDGHNIEVDHINGDKLDNRVSNLQLLSVREHKNKAPTKGQSSKYNGVSAHRNKWKARAVINKTRVHLGVFDTEIEAYNAYKIAINKKEDNV